VRASDEVRVVVAAGGLGTGVHHWARYLPKEFQPVGGRPGITWILEEIAGLGAAHIVIVYHPYYRACHLRVAKPSARQGATISDALFPARES
jgi:UTP-glucose-1-phosphate uridylyltransferase